MSLRMALRMSLKVSLKMSLKIIWMDSIAMLLGVSSKTIKRRIKGMDNVCYIGSGYSGHWEIID